MRAFLFPGQGSQKLKMGMALAENHAAAREAFEEVDEALSRKLSAIIFGDDAEELSKTENAQPALLAVSIATLRTIEQMSGKKIQDLAGMACGHSLGEYSALAAAGAIGLSECAKLLERRARAMAAAVPEGTGAMMAIIGLGIEQVREVAAKASAGGLVCAVANDNCPGQVVVSGHRDAILAAEEIAKELGARKCVILPVSVPAHSPLMAPAKAEVEAALAGIDMKIPAVPFVSNRTASIVSEPAEIKTHLAEQTTQGVRFRECAEFMAEAGADEFFEIGSGSVLSGLVKRTVEEASATALDGIEAIEEFLKTL
jgi:[acyl-carrier-protein] S-malonyltransferase